MALTFVQRHTLINAAPFRGRIEAAIIKYAVYLHNNSTAGRLGTWAAQIIDRADYRSAWVERVLCYAIENVAAAGALVAAGDDSDATDSALGAEVETRIQALV